MKKIFNVMLCVLKYLLLIVAIVSIVFCVMIMYKRLDKSIFDSDGLSIVVPISILFIIYIINLLFNQRQVNGNLLYNFVATITFISILFICYRAKFDTNMVLYHKYKIQFNSGYFADNLVYIKIMIYFLIASDIFYIFGGEKKKKNCIATMIEPVKTNENII